MTRGVEKERSGHLCHWSSASRGRAVGNPGTSAGVSRGAGGLNSSCLLILTVAVSPTRGRAGCAVQAAGGPGSGSGIWSGNEILGKEKNKTLLEHLTIFSEGGRLEWWAGFLPKVPTVGSRVVYGLLGAPPCPVV